MLFSVLNITNNLIQKKSFLYWTLVFIVLSIWTERLLKHRRFYFYFISEFLWRKKKIYSVNAERIWIQFFFFFFFEIWYFKERFAYWISLKFLKISILQKKKIKKINEILISEKKIKINSTQNAWNKKFIDDIFDFNCFVITLMDYVCQHCSLNKVNTSFK